MESSEPASVRQRAPPGRRAEGILALLVVQLCFGLSPLFAKWALAPRGGFAPRALVAWRILFGALFLGALAAWKHPREILPPWRELPRLALCALLGIALNMWLYLEGVTRASVVHTGLLVTQIPVFTYAVACLARVERVQLRRVSGIALALCGALLLVLERAPAQGSGGSALGNLLLVSNCLSYAIYLVLARGLLQRFPTLVVIAWVFWCALAAVPFLLWGVAPWPAERDPRALAGLAYTLFFGTFLAYLLNAVALARVPASTVAIFIFLQPLVAGAAGVLVLDERISPAELGAAAALLAGITLVAWEGPGKRGGTKESSQRRAARVFHSRR
jgi:drug/metabolite transporter (DMT)-like permease